MTVNEVNRVLFTSHNKQSRRRQFLALIQRLRNSVRVSESFVFWLYLSVLPHGEKTALLADKM